MPNLRGQALRLGQAFDWENAIGKLPNIVKT